MLGHLWSQYAYAAIKKMKDSKKIAVICAFPTGLNPGMISVDQAATEIIKIINEGNNLQAVFYTTEGNIKVQTGKNKFITYQHYHEQEQLDEFDAILFWGDFGHWLNYAEKEWCKRQLSRSHKVDKSIENWYKLYFFSGRDDLKAKTITYGETLYGINGGHLSNSRYMSELKTFYNLY